MHVIFIAPHFPASQPRFVRGLKQVGARVTGIGDAPLSAVPASVRAMLDGYEEVRNVGDADAVTEAVRRIQKRGPWVHHLEATIETHMLAAAAARERCGIPGLSYQTVLRCRDKFIMKQFLGGKGIPTAACGEVHRADDLRRFAAAQGFPLILKPRAAAGAAGTHRIDSEADLERVVREEGLERGEHHLAAESFISGHEGFFDTLTVNGEVKYEFVCHYYPNVLEAMRTRWINPQILVTNRIEAEGYNALRLFGRKVGQALGLSTTATHMEWFYGPKGLTFSEIGCRPPGCNMWDLYSAANDIDIYQEWARAVCWGSVQAPLSRRYSAGLISIRPSQDGTIKGYTGVEEMQRRYGAHIVDAHLPAPGSRTSPVEAGYLAHAWVRVRHPDYDACRRMLDDIGQSVKMWAS